MRKKLFMKKDYKSDISSNKKWFVDAVDDYEHTQRISNVLTIKEYLARKHKVLNRPDGKHKGEVFETAKIVINSIKSILDFHVSYVVGNPISINGHKDIVKDFNKVYKQGSYSKVDMQIATDLWKYADAFEYVYLDNNTQKIRSKVIANEDSYPIYDENYNYVAFVEYYPNSLDDKFHIVYYPDKVEKYENESLINTYTNLTGLPIHYSSLDKSLYSQFGDSILNDLIPLMDRIEYLLSKTDDSVTKQSLNPLGISKGKKLNVSIPEDMVGAVLNMDDDGDFKYETTMLDHSTIKLLLENLINQFYVVAGVPSTIVGQAEINNVSETSLQLLFSQTDNKAKKTAEVLKEGMLLRFDYFRKLKESQGVYYTDDIYDTLGIAFNFNRPVDNGELFKNLEIQRNVGAISKQTIIDLSPYTTDTAEEIRRIEEEAAAEPSDTNDEVLSDDTQNNNNNTEDINR